jgi:hypothetical protein
VTLPASRTIRIDYACRCKLGSERVEGTCRSCPAGTFLDFYMSRCTSCPIGSVAPAGSYECTVCDGPGQIGPSASAACETCPAAGQRPNPNRSNCEDCPRGLVSSDGISCHPCSAGYLPNALHTDCVECQAGSFGSGDSSDESFQCIECPAGTAQLLPGQPMCSPCSKGSFTAIGGSR